MYLISNIIRLLTVTAIFIFSQIKPGYGSTIIEYIVMGKFFHKKKKKNKHSHLSLEYLPNHCFSRTVGSIYFWVCAYSWYVMLSNMQAAPND